MGNPSGKCPRCGEEIKLERRGKQNCQECGKRIDVAIEDVPVDREIFGSDHDTRTRIMEG